MIFQDSFASRSGRLLVLCLTLLATACGSHSGLQSGALEPGVQQNLPELAQLLPALADLPEAPRSADMLGPGWYSVPLLDAGVLLARGGSVGPNGEGIELTAGTEPAWALFAVQGFDGDSFPSSLMVEASVSDGLAYVAASEFLTGRWQFSEGFSADKQFEYPGVSPSSNPLQYVNGKGAHYIAVLAAPGSSVQLSGLQLGVSGGQNAPVPPLYLDASSGDSGIVLNWDKPESHFNPDFAGYAVERSIWPATDYQSISPLSKNNWFHDTDVLEDGKYRYRLRLEDVSGNISHGISITVVQAFGDSPPVPVLEMPTGPLHGAQVVHFDLSESFDPDGDAIDDYQIAFAGSSGGAGPLPVAGMDSQKDILLQPGCYQILASVHANGQSGTEERRLQILPEWQDSPRLISAMPVTEQRLRDSRSIYYPQTDSVVTVFKDPVAPGLGLLQQLPDGSTNLFQLGVLNTDIDAISELAIWQGQVFAAVIDDGTHRLASFNGTEFRWEEGIFSTSNSPYVDLVVDGDNRLRLCYMKPAGGGKWVIVAEDTNTYDSKVQLTNKTDTDGWFDVEWNAALGTYDLVYPAIGAEHWRRMDPGSGGLDDTPLTIANVTFADLEIDPASGVTGVILRVASFLNYYEYDNEAMSFNIVEVIDSSFTNSLASDLLFVDSQPTCFFGRNGQASALYRRVEGGWEPTLADWTASSGYFCSTALWPDNSVQVIDGAFDLVSHIVRINQANEITPVTSLPPAGYQGRELNAVFGADGMHVCWISDNLSLHALGSFAGTDWIGAPSGGAAQALELMSDIDGDVFLSVASAGTGILKSWNGAAWVVEDAQPRWGGHQPWMMSQSSAPGGQWWIQDNTVVPTQLRRIHDDDGLGFVSDASDLDDPLLYEAAAVWTINGPVSFAVAGTALFNQGRVGFCNRDSGQFNQFVQGGGGLSNGTLVSGRQIDGSNFVNRYGQVSTVFWTSYGADGAPTRISGTSSGADFNLDELASLDPDFLFDNPGYLRTVSCGDAWGLTAVCLADQFSGPVAELQWSSFGDFEDIALPPIDFAQTQMHELVIGNDGRWHIVYRDRLDGGIYIISTT